MTRLPTFYHPLAKIRFSNLRLTDGRVGKKAGALTPVASAAICDLLEGNFASLPSARAALLIFGAYPADRRGRSQRGIVRLIVRLMGRLVAEITPRIFAVCSEGQDNADGADYADGCVPLS